MSIKVLTNSNGASFWHLVATNGEILAHSEAYACRSSCLRTARKVAKELSLKLITK